MTLAKSEICSLQGYKIVRKEDKKDTRKAHNPARHNKLEQ